MKDEKVFGESEAIETERPIRMAVPGRALNPIEIHLLGQAAIAAETCEFMPPIPFIDADDQTYDGLPLRTVLDLRDYLLLQTGEKFRRAITIAHEQGPMRPDGGPTTEEFEIACLAEGVIAWPVGDGITIIKR